MSILPDFTLRTPRLLLRAFTPQDAQRVFEIRSDFEVTRMLVFPAYPPDWAVLAGLGTALFTGLLFGVLPARNAARLDPVTALARR